MAGFSFFCEGGFNDWTQIIIFPGIAPIRKLRANFSFLVEQEQKRGNLIY
jgi:hypothetical protein